MHTNQVQPGYLFVGLAKEPDKLKQHCLAAQARGAKSILVDEQQAHYVDFPNPYLLSIPDLQQNLPYLLKVFYGTAIDRLHITGVTGTNGKSSVSYYIFQLIHQLQLGKPGLINTVFWGTMDQLMPSGMTTPDLCTLYQYLRWMADHAVSHVIMEISSHALDQNRIAGLNIHTAIFTNLSQDHLDYHHTMEHYAASKRKLFSLPGLKKAVLNLDDAYGRQLFMELQARQQNKQPALKLYTYSMEEEAIPDDSLPHHHLNHHSFKADFYFHNNHLHLPSGQIKTDIDLPGSIIRINTLAAVSAIYADHDTNKITHEHLTQAIQQLKQVPGRLEKIVWQGRTIYIDYAHTPDALVKVLEDINKAEYKKLWCLFGCGGDRDQTKRAAMGYSASCYAHRLILTNDNPRMETPESIIAGIVEGINQAKSSLTSLPLKQTDIILDRQEAITYVLDHAETGDVILIAGKGHETTQEIQGQFYPFNDKQQVEQYIKQHSMRRL